MSEDLAVVHLVWGPLGAEALGAFVRAYRRFDPGEPHELVVVFNGVEQESSARTGDRPGPASRARLLAELSEVEHRLVELERPVLDLGAYFALAARLPHARLCFLNSFSEPLLDGWLALLARAADRPGVGVAGATGSWQSHSSHVRFLLGFGGPYARMALERPLTRRVFASIHQAEPARVGGAGHGRQVAGAQLRRRIAALGAMAHQISVFPQFPTPHLRTNGFLIARELMLELQPGRLRDKLDAYALESGRNSLTEQIEQRGRRVLVVARDGTVYGKGEWPASATFWQGAQENLVIADKQTRAYEHGDFAVRRVLSLQAWGERAAPGAPFSARPAHASAPTPGARRAGRRDAATGD